MIQKHSLSKIAHCLLTGFYPDDITNKPTKLSIHKQNDGMISINGAVCFASSKDEDSAVLQMLDTRGNRQHGILPKMQRMVPSKV